MNCLNFIFAALAVLSFALALWQWLAAKRFPLHKRIADFGFVPAISILKPLKGCDDTTFESLESWLKQKYSGQIQILFGVADANDPVCKIIEMLLQKYPEADVKLIVCAENLGANAKVATLAQLEKLAKHELILASDADVRVPEDFLANVVAPFSQELVAADVSPLNLIGADSHRLLQKEVGLVNCFYRLANPATSAMQWEAIAVNADFWSQVLQSQMLKPMDFALGAVMLTRRKILGEIGGFKSLVNCLADDYQLGNRIAKKGYRIEICPVVVECWDSPMNWRDVWRHQLRWARTIRSCQPLPYFFSILSNATFWSLVWLVWSLSRLTVKTRALDGGAGWVISTALPCGVTVAIFFCLARIFIAYDLQKRFTANWKLVSPFWLVPVKDLFQAAIWFFAFAGNTVEWRGKKLKLRRDGTLVEQQSK
ncbi:MAG TPA: glycosyltransferase [Verrucomicrobiae bacterium]|nr:glycosyltransferase [Verrucomicrobiae bacterium]